MTNEQLAALDAAATQENLEPDGRYFEGSCDNFTQCNHGDTGEYRRDADGELIAALWNLYRAGHLVVRTEPSEADVERVAQAINDVNGGINYDYADFCRDAARAAIAAMVR